MLDSECDLHHTLQKNKIMVPDIALFYFFPTLDNWNHFRTVNQFLDMILFSICELVP